MLALVRLVPVDPPAAFVRERLALVTVTTSTLPPPAGALALAPVSFVRGSSAALATRAALPLASAARCLSESGTTKVPSSLRLRLATGLAL